MSVDSTDRNLYEEIAASSSLTSRLSTEPQSIQSDGTGHTDETQLLLSTDDHGFIQIGCWRCNCSDRLLCSIGALPITFAMLILSALVINYSIAVYLRHLSPFFPFVSWLGSKGPEEYIYDFLLSLATINVAFIIYFKYKTISLITSDAYLWRKIISFNKACYVLGFITSLLFLISATFPAVEDEASIRKVHSYASLIGFAILCIYFVIESVMSFHIRHRIPGVTTCICITRSVVAGLCIGCLVTAFIASKLSYKAFKADNGKDDKHWKPSEGGYVLHLVAAFCEWGIVLLMVFFFMTYIAELRHFQTNVKLKLRKGRVLNASQQPLPPPQQQQQEQQQLYQQQQPQQQQPPQQQEQQLLYQQQ